MGNCGRIGARPPQSTAELTKKRGVDSVERSTGDRHENHRQNCRGDGTCRCPRRMRGILVRAVLRVPHAIRLSGLLPVGLLLLTVLLLPDLLLVELGLLPQLPRQPA